MNIWLKLRKTAAITLCELLAIATIFTGCASTDLSGTEGAGHAAGAEVAGEDSSGALGSKDNADGPQEDLVNNNSYVSLDAIPAYDGKAYVAVNNNEPFFTDSDMTTTALKITVIWIHLADAVWLMPISARISCRLRSVAR